MSASKEKRARKNAVITKSTHDMRTQQEAKEDRSFYVKCIVAVVALAVAFVLCFLYSNDNIRKGMTAVTVGGEKYSATEVDYYYQTSLNNYSGYFSMFGVDPSQDLDSQAYTEDQSWGDFLREDAATNLHHTSAMYQAAIADGYELSEEGKKDLESFSTSIDDFCEENGMTREQFIQNQYGPKMTDEILMKHTEMMLVASEYVQQYLDSAEYTDEEIKTYYEENPAEIDRADYEVLTINADYSGMEPAESEAPADASAEDAAPAPAPEYTEAQTKEAMEAAHTQADAIQKRVADGESLKDIGDEIGDRYYSSKTNAAHSDYTSYSFNDWVFDAERENGENAVIEDADNECWYVVVLNKRYRPEDSTVNAHYFFFAPADSGLQEGQDGYEEAKELNDAKAKADADKALAAYKSGEKTFAALAEERGAANEGAVEQLISGSGTVAPEVDAWLFDDSREAGDITVVKTSSGYALVSFDGTDIPSWEARCINGLKDQWITDIYDNAQLKVHNLGMKAVG